MKYATFFLLFLMATTLLLARRYGLEADRVIVETFPRDQNTDREWWVNSGAYFTVNNHIGRTIQGDLPPSDRFFGLYQKNAPEDTDGGSHPQNLFRLVTNDSWTNYQQTVYFRITNLHLSASSNRNESNGVLFFLRYADGDHLYYAGIRVDGTAVIKKKNGGLAFYTTLDQNVVYTDGRSYNRNDPARSNFIPTNTWIGMTAIVQTLSTGQVWITLWLDRNGDEDWILVAEAVDDGHTNGLSFLEAGNGGIRTDFMDAEFHSYIVNDLDRRLPYNRIIR